MFHKLVRLKQDKKVPSDF